MAPADGTVRSWDLNATEPTGRIFGDRINSAVKTVAVGTVNGRAVAISGSDDNAIRMRDLDERAQRCQPGTDMNVRFVRDLRSELV